MNFIEQLEGLVSSRIAVAKGIWTLLKLEAKLARLNVVPLLIAFGAMAALLITTWLTLMLLIGYLVTVVTGGYLAVGIIVVLLINIGFVGYTLKWISACIQRMSFERTRSCFADKYKDNHDSPEQVTGFDS